MITLPPTKAGADQVTVAWPEAVEVADPIAGASGTVFAVAGVTVLDTVDVAPRPMALMALMVKVEEDKLVSPVMVVVRTGPSTSGLSGLAGFDVTRYPVMSLPPSITGAFQLKMDRVSPIVALPLVGASGTLALIVLPGMIDGAGVARPGTFPNRLAA